MLALLLFGDTVRTPALRHELPLAIVDPVLFAEADGRRFVLTTRFEADRVKEAAPDVEVLDWIALGYKDLAAGGMSDAEAEREVAARAVKEIGIEAAVVPGGFPLGLGDLLRERGVELLIDDTAVDRRRRVKTPAELEGIRVAQRAAEAAMAAAREHLFSARPQDGRLMLDGKPLLAEDVRRTLRDAARAHGAPCPPDMIVASVWQGSGHDPGHGPLPAGLPIQIDLWPQHEASGCWADMTRTFVVGEPAPGVVELAALVRRSHDEAIAAVRAGVTGRAIFDVACDVLEAEGHATSRTGDEEHGFQWSLGHGVGLDVHEEPMLGLAGHEPLLAGDVVALEPGIVDAELGEIRFEDLVLVTDTGAEVLTQFSYETS